MSDRMQCVFCGQESGCYCQYIYGATGYVSSVECPPIKLENPWNAIHTDPEPSQEWLSRWERTIPCGECYEFYLKLKEQYPPDFTDIDSIWRWGWFIHNAVNEKLIAAGDTSKKIIPLEEARKIWNRPQLVE